MTTQYINNISDGTNTYVIQDPNAGINQRDRSALPIWHGTQVQWEQGENTPWYYWQTSINISCITGDSISNMDEGTLIFGNDLFLIHSGKNTTTYYSSSNGTTWTSRNMLSSKYWLCVAYGNGKFIAFPGSSQGLTVAYSTDGINWTEGELPQGSAGYYYAGVYTGNRFIAVTTSSSPKSVYSTDGINWYSGTDLPDKTNHVTMCYAKGICVIAPGYYGKDYIIYSDDEGVTWKKSTLESTGSWSAVAYGNNMFIILDENNSSGKYIYSMDGINWSESTTLPTGRYWNHIAFGDGKFVATNGGTFGSDVAKDIAYSTDGINWTLVTLNVHNYGKLITYGNEKFVLAPYQMNGYATYSLTISSFSCYTLDSEPTTSSTVYSAPLTTSALTVSSVTSGAITLSDNNTYYYASSGDTSTYRTVGDVHPEYLCFIDNVGVKIGNTNITPVITTSITSSSTDTEVPSAKAVYDKIEESNS